MDEDKIDGEESRQNMLLGMIAILILGACFASNPMIVGFLIAGAGIATVGLAFTPSKRDIQREVETESSCARLAEIIPLAECVLAEEQFPEMSWVESVRLANQNQGSEHENNRHAGRC